MHPHPVGESVVRERSLHPVLRYGIGTRERSVRDLLRVQGYPVRERYDLRDRVRLVEKLVPEAADIASSGDVPPRIEGEVTFAVRCQPVEVVITEILVPSVPEILPPYFARLFSGNPWLNEYSRVTGPVCIFVGRPSASSSLSLKASAPFTLPSASVPCE